MIPCDVEVPDLLWKDRSLNDRAKLLWCHLVINQRRASHMPFQDLREITVATHQTVLNQLHALSKSGWLRWSKADLRAIQYEALPREGAAITLPSDLLTDHHIAIPAMWIWGVIKRLGQPFGYPTLEALSGFCHKTTAQCLRQLTESCWLEGTERRGGQPTLFSLQPVNPLAVKRQSDLAELQRALSQAKNRSGYSLGQCLMVRMVRLITAAPIIQNAEIPGLENSETGGQMHYDAYLPDYNVALEFHGPQHDGPTQRFPSVKDYQSQRDRDLKKLGISHELGITVLVVRAQDLHFERLRERLSGLVPLQESLDDQHHLYLCLKDLAARYRHKAKAA